MDWRDLTDKQRDLCRQAQQEERDSITQYLRQLGGLRFVEQDPAELLRIIANDVGRGMHRRTEGTRPLDKPRREPGGGT